MAMATRPMPVRLLTRLLTTIPPVATRCRLTPAMRRTPRSLLATEASIGRFTGATTDIVVMAMDTVVMATDTEDMVMLRLSGGTAMDMDAELAMDTGDIRLATGSGVVPVLPGAATARQAVATDQVGLPDAPSQEAESLAGDSMALGASAAATSAAEAAAANSCNIGFLTKVSSPLD